MSEQNPSTAAATTTAPTMETRIEYGSNTIGAENKADTGVAYATGPAVTEPATEPAPVAQAPAATEAQTPLLNDKGEMSSKVADVPNVPAEEIDFTPVSKHTALARQSLPPFLKLGEIAVGEIEIDILEPLGSQSVASFNDLPQMPIYLFAEVFDAEGKKKTKGHVLYLQITVGEKAQVLKNVNAWGEMLYTKLTSFFQTDRMVQEHLGGKYQIVGSMFNPEQWLRETVKANGRADIWANLSVNNDGTRSSAWTWYLHLPHIPVSIVLEPAGTAGYKSASKPNELHLSTVLQRVPYIIRTVLHKDVNIGQFFTVPGLIKAVVQACDTYLPMPSTWHHTTKKEFSLLKPAYQADFLEEVAQAPLAPETPVAEATGVQALAPTEDFKSNTGESNIADKLTAAAEVKPAE